MIKKRMLPMLLLAASCFSLAQPNVPAVAWIDGVPLLRTEFDTFTANQLLRLKSDLYAAEVAILDEAIENRLLAAEAKHQNITVKDLIQREVTGKIPKVSEAEARAVLENAGKRDFSEASLESVMSDLARRRAATRRAEYLIALRQEHDVKILLPAPRVTGQIFKGESVGPLKAPVDIVEFSDFQCPFCGSFSMTLNEVLRVYEDKVRLTYKHFPLPIHPQAEKAAQASVCAAEQGKFWDMHDRLFAEQRLLAAAAFKEIAVRADLDLPVFEACLRKQSPATSVARDFAEGLALGISATPSFLINGRLFTGARSAAALKELIDTELELVGRE